MRAYKHGWGSASARVCRGTHPKRRSPFTPPNSSVRVGVKEVEQEPPPHLRVAELALHRDRLELRPEDLPIPVPVHHSIEPICRRGDNNDSRIQMVKGCQKLYPTEEAGTHLGAAWACDRAWKDPPW